MTATFFASADLDLDDEKVKESIQLLEFEVQAIRNDQRHKKQRRERLLDMLTKGGSFVTRLGSQSKTAITLHLEAIRDEWFESEQGRKRIEQATVRNTDTLLKHGLLDVVQRGEDSQLRDKES